MLRPGASLSRARGGRPELQGLHARTQELATNSPHRLPAALMLVGALNLLLTLCGALSSSDLPAGLTADATSEEICVGAAAAA